MREEGGSGGGGGWGKYRRVSEEGGMGCEEKGRGCGGNKRRECGGEAWEGKRGEKNGKGRRAEGQRVGRG